MILVKVHSKQLLRLAEESADPNELRSIAAKSANLEVLLKLAANQYTPPDTLDLLANHKNEDVRCEVAENKSTSAETRKRLARDKSQFVRNALLPLVLRTHRCKTIADNVVSIPSD